MDITETTTRHEIYFTVLPWYGSHYCYSNILQESVWLWFKSFLIFLITCLNSICHFFLKVLATPILTKNTNFHSANSYLLFVLYKQPSNKVFSFLWNISKGFFIKVPVTGFYILQSLYIVFTSKWWQTTQPESKDKGNKYL